MRTPRSWPTLLGTLAFAGQPAPAGAQPVGSEFQINTYTSSSQTTGRVGCHRLVAADASGNFVVVWASNYQDGNKWGVFGQRYDSAGVAQGAEFQVNSYTTLGQRYPSVAAAVGGDFVVVWQSWQDSQQVGFGVFGQRYDSAGGALGTEFHVNSYTTWEQESPCVATDADGNFVVVWHGNVQDGHGFGIFGQRYDSAGGTLGGEFRVNSYTTYGQVRPSIASDAGGNFVVVWQSYHDGGSGQSGKSGIFGQRYDNAGSALGSEFRVNSYTTGAQRYPSVASDTSGNFVVVWDSYQDGGSGYPGQRGVFGQRYDSGGVARGGEFRVNSHTPYAQQRPAVASDASGNFIVVWESAFQDGDGGGIFGQRYDSAGVAQGGEFQINSYTAGQQQYPSVGATGTDQFVVAWSSEDGSSFGVFGQRFDFSGDTPMLHAGDLDRRAKNIGANWRAQVTTLVHDNGHSPVSGALVTLDVSGVGTRTCTTTAAGNCEVSVVISDSVPNLTFSVTNLSKAGFSYDAAANHDPDPDSNGTTIVVNQP